MFLSQSIVCLIPSSTLVDGIEPKVDDSNVGSDTKLPISPLDVINFKNNGIGYKTDLTKPYYMVLLHPVTTSANNNVLINNVFESIKNLNEQVIWIWPNNDAGATIITKRIRSFREKYNNLKINFFINFEAEDYLKLLKKLKKVILSLLF